MSSRIKEAFSAKDQKIEELSAINQLSQKKVKQLENLLDKMRLVGWPLRQRLRQDVAPPAGRTVSPLPLISSSVCPLNGDWCT